jgi:hypothetical protein
MRVVIAGKKHCRSERLNFSGPRRSYPPARGHYDLDSLIRTTLIAIDRRDDAIARASVPNRFCASLSAEQKPGSARRDERADKCRRRRRRADAKIVIFDFRPYFFDAGDKPARYRHVRGKSDETPTTSVGRVDGRAEGSIRIRHCGILNSFFAPTALLASRLRAAVVVRKSIQVCKDRALKRRILSRERERMSLRIDQGAGRHRSPALLSPWTVASEKCVEIQS